MTPEGHQPLALHWKSNKPCNWAIELQLIFSNYTMWYQWTIVLSFAKAWHASREEPLTCYTYNETSPLLLWSYSNDHLNLFALYENIAFFLWVSIGTRGATGCLFLKDAVTYITVTVCEYKLYNSLFVCTHRWSFILHLLEENNPLLIFICKFFLPSNLLFIHLSFMYIAMNGTASRTALLLWRKVLWKERGKTPRAV